MNNNEQWHKEPEGLHQVLADVAALVRDDPHATMRQVNEVLGRHNRTAGDANRRFAKKHLLPGFLRLERENPAQLEQWGLREDARKRLFSLLRMKPRRTASGVATITVLTKPWPCSSNCDYCPSDIRMPKSYLSDEPACQRAERNFFDPYLQVHARLHTLNQMGHPTDKVELIVLGGTWSDYPLPYQRWFMTDLFRALNDGDSEAALKKAHERRMAYEQVGLTSDKEALQAQCAQLQQTVNSGHTSYNQAVRSYYGIENTIGDIADSWQEAATWQTASWEELFAEQALNESVSSRCVGLVVETRPTLVNTTTLQQLRAFGCTKVQIGIQTLNPAIATANNRQQDNEAIAHAFQLLRLFGFKIHSHFMANLQGATPEADREDFRKLVEDARFKPDEVKLYPCVLVAGTKLEERYHQGLWTPYAEDELVALLADDVLAAPSYLRVSRMIRDISAPDILAGSKKTNLRQMVEQSICDRGLAGQVNEIRFREIAREALNPETLTLQDIPYETTGSQEHFLQWVTPEGKIVGFLRLSLAKPQAFLQSSFTEKGAATQDDEEAAPTTTPNNAEPIPAPAQGKPAALPAALTPKSAMIREVHVYGAAAPIHQAGESAQHTGLGRALVAQACQLAKAAGYKHINVISAVGTRGYYRSLGFSDNGLYQTRDL